MKRELPALNRLLKHWEYEKNNGILLQKIMSMKYSNISSLKLSPLSVRHRPHLHPVEYNKIVPSSQRRQITVKSVLARECMLSQNKKIYDRLISQKSSVSAKLFADERQKNIQFLRRIGKYSHQRKHSMKVNPTNEEQSNNKNNRSYKVGDLQQGINIRTKDYSPLQYRPILSPFPQEERKEHTIMLYSRVVKLAKHWCEVRFMRLKNHYQIILQPCADSKIQYRLKLQQSVGTAMLSQNDYDYEMVYTNFIKFTKQYVCLAFQLTHPNKKKYFYRFEKRDRNEIEEENHISEQDTGQEQLKRSESKVKTQDQVCIGEVKIIEVVESQAEQIQNGCLSQIKPSIVVDSFKPGHKNIRIKDVINFQCLIPNCNFFKSVFYFLQNYQYGHSLIPIIRFGLQFNID